MTSAIWTVKMMVCVSGAMQCCVLRQKHFHGGNIGSRVNSPLRRPSFWRCYTIWVCITSQHGWDLLIPTKCSAKKKEAGLNFAALKQQWSLQAQAVIQVRQCVALPVKVLRCSAWHARQLVHLVPLAAI